jgi:hypothetical protein
MKLDDKELKNIASSAPECIEVFLLRLKQKLQSGAKRGNQFTDSPKGRTVLGSSTMERSVGSKSQPKRVQPPAQRRV